jgi:uncharacterized protein (TIGR03435 family)
MLSLALAGASIAAASLHGQTPSPAFEVATVRINESGDPSRSIRPMPGGRLEATNVPLRNLIRFAYEVRTLGEIDGGPDWIASAAFDIVAKGAPEGSQPAMMRALLADRFKLTVHRETRELPVLALTRARTDGKLGTFLNPSTVDCATPRACYRRSTPTQYEQRGQQMAELARTLAALLGEHVIDRTGLAGPWDLIVDFSPEQLPGVLPPGVSPPSADANLPSLFTAVQEQLGLKLERTRAPVEILVVDRAEMPALD